MFDFSILIKKFNPTDPRLGRNVRHDSRSLNYLVAPRDLSTLVSVKHERFIPTLNQADLGSCTGNAGTGVLGSAAFWDTDIVRSVLSPTDASADESFAVGVYSEATSIDSFDGTYPPTDTGSDGLSVAKVLKNRGLISGYRHATSLEAALTALAEQPVMVGTHWFQKMFQPDPDGRLRIGGSIEGGHEYVLDELDMENELVWMHNSWGDSWGIDGRAYITFDDMRALLAMDGDCTVLVPVTEPAPQPTPPEPTPTPEPTPEPTPTPEPVVDNKEQLDKIAQNLADVLNEVNALRQ